MLEAPVFNLQSALDAARYGIHRLELCANLPEGGETPSAGMLRFLKNQVDIPVFVMIRPRGGDFYYSQKELMVMKRDIEILGEMGADGFVFGVLDEKGYVDTESCESLIRAANGKPCTFHRAFDASADFHNSLEKIIDCGFQRILTSGGQTTTSEGLALIMGLMEKAGDRIIIMPGGGSKPSHLEFFSESRYFKEIHASCKVRVPSANQYINPNVKFSDDPESFTYHWGIDKQVVEEFLKLIEK